MFDLNQHINIMIVQCMMLLYGSKALWVCGIYSAHDAMYLSFLSIVRLECINHHYNVMDLIGILQFHV